MTPIRLLRIAAAAALLSLALAGCNAPPDIVPTPGYTSAPPTSTYTAPPRISPVDLDFTGSNGDIGIDTQLPDTPIAHEIARVTFDTQGQQTTTADPQPPSVDGLRIASTCTGGSGSSTVTVSGHESYWQFPPMVVQCNNSVFVFRIGTATPYTPPFELKIEAPADTQGFAVLLEDDADG